MVGEFSRSLAKDGTAQDQLGRNNRPPHGGQARGRGDMPPRRLHLPGRAFLAGAASDD